MFKILATFLSSFVVIGFVACSGGGGSGVDNADEIRDREQNKALFSTLTGTYTGQIKTSERDLTVELRLFTLETPNGTNADGSTRFTKTLQATLVPMDPVGSFLAMQTRYLKETGELIMKNNNPSGGVDTNPDGGSTGTYRPDEIFSISAVVSKERITGAVNSMAGLLGTLDVKLATRESQGLGGTEENKYYERLQREYEKVAGIYRGSNISNGKVTYEIEISLQVVKSGKLPTLIGMFTRDDDPLQSVALNLTAIYQPQLKTPALTLTGKPRFANSPYVAIFDGDLKDGIYNGSWRTNMQGPQGEFRLIKQP